MADENDLNIKINANPSGVEAGSKRAGAAIKGIAKDTVDLEAALKRFRSSLDPTFAAMEKYNQVHKENLALKRQGIVTDKEYREGMKIAKRQLEAEIDAINRRSAAGRAAAAAERQRIAEQRAASRAAAQAEAQAAREAAAAKRTAATQARQQAKEAVAAEKAAIREAAAAARQAAREKSEAEKQAAREIRQALSEQRRQEKADARAAAAAIRQAAREKAQAEKEAAREASAAERQAKKEAAQAAREAAATAKQEARDKLAAERQASRDAAAAERQAKREAREAARDAANAAKQAARDKTKAEREAARATREAAVETERQARAARQAARAEQELRASIDPVYASQTRYNETMRIATQLLMQNKLKEGEWIAIQKQAKIQMDVNTRSLGRMNSVYVQLGYQAQDVTASLASGINPLVILAQQGGQTAAALSQMGGTTGKIASFFAGPWGAAIIGFTLLLGYLWQSEDEGKKKTLDLMDAESRRKAGLGELTDALKDYVKQQTEANNVDSENIRLKGIQAGQTKDELQKKVDDARKAKDDAQKELDDLQSPTMAGLDPTGGQMAANSAQALTAAREKLRKATEALNLAQKSLTENEIAAANYQADNTEEDKRHNARLQELTTLLRGVTDERRKGQAIKDYTALRAAEMERHSKAVEAERQTQRDLNAELKLTFQSREAAIQQAGRELQHKGFTVGENFAFGHVGEHPGMGRQAHGKFAIDVNLPTSGGKDEAFDSAAKAKMDSMVRAYQARGFRILWNGKVYNPMGSGPSYDIPSAQNQHTNHSHIEAPQSIVGKASGAALGNSMEAEINKEETAEQQARRRQVEAEIANLEFKKELNAEDLAEVIKIQDQKIKVIEDFYGKDSKEAADAQREKVRIERNLAKETLKIKKDQLEQTLALMLKSYETEKSLAELNMQERQAVVNFAEQQGVISAREALMMKAALRDQEFQEEVAHENRMFEAKQAELRAELALDSTPAERRNQLNREIEANEADHLGRMRILHATYNNDVGSMERQAQSIGMQKWREFGDSVTSGMTQAFQGLWTRSITLQQAFINMADQQVYRLVDMGAKALEDWVMQQVKMTGVQHAQEAARTAVAVGGEARKTAAAATGAATRTGIQVTAAGTEQTIQTTLAGAAVAKEAVKTGAAVTGAATQTGVAATAGMGELTTNAAVAASGAYKSTVVIPFIGPIAAPAAAALALAAVLGFGAMISSKGGMGEIKSDGQLATLHAKETVLPAWIAEPMRQMFVSPRSSGGMIGAAAGAGNAARMENTQSTNANFFYQPQHNNYDASLETLLRRDSHTMRKWIRNEVRNGGLKLPA